MISTSTISLIKKLPSSKRYLQYYNIVAKARLTSNAINHRSKNWTELYNILHQVNSNGINGLEEKYLPIKSRKPKADGETLHHFVDYCKIQVVGGNGGDGCISLLQVFLDAQAGPDGGDGGHGGHILLKATKKNKSLSHLDSRLVAKSGEPGSNKNCHGKNASDLEVEVPVGTIIKSKDNVIANLDCEGDIFVAARGGAGGKGNAFFATSTEQTPKVAEVGGQGEKFTYEVELRTMADVGLIGFPNAGKSTLLRAISRARPKVASYPFTTLRPHVGMVSFADHHQIAIADIPGLVEGSHRNLGIGAAFLKHIQRCSSLVYVLDGSEEDPLRQLSVLKNELEFYEKGLSERPHAVVLNKIDLPKAQENLQRLRDECDLPVIPVSGKLGQNLVPLIVVMRFLTESSNS